MSADSETDRLTIKEAIVIVGAMVFIAVITLTFAIRMLRASQIVDKSTREENPPTIREPLPVPNVPTLPPKDDEESSGAR